MMVGAGKGFEGFEQLVKWVAVGIESIAIGIIVLGAITTTVIFIWRVIQEGTLEDCYRKFRSDFGKAVLLGLEFLIASEYCWDGSDRSNFSGPGGVGPLGDNPHLSEFCPGAGDLRPLALAKSPADDGSK